MATCGRTLPRPWPALTRLDVQQYPLCDVAEVIDAVITQDVTEAPEFLYDFGVTRLFDSRIQLKAAICSQRW